MTKFAYVAVAADGALLKGTHSAESVSEARRALAERQIEVTEIAPKGGILQLEITAHRMKRDDLMHLSRQFAAFLRAGIPILDAIATLSEEADDPVVARIMTAIGDDLREGATLSDAVDKHPKDFPSFYRGILRSAELTGSLDTVLEQLATYLERDLEAKRKIKSALIYPMIIAAMSLLTICVLAIYVLPQFADFFKSLDAKLPLPTRMLLGVTDFVTRFWWAGAGTVVVAAGGYVAAVRDPRGRMLRDKVLLGVPVLGVTIKYALIERFTRLLASMVTAGVALPEAMKVASDALHNLVFEEALGTARAQMIEGAGLAGPIARTKLFPGVAAQMFRVGEETGTLHSQLDVAASYYERELDYKLKKLTAVFEPAVIAVMGLIVGFVAIALVAAMYGIFRAAHDSGAV